jgi:GNAT superfamily N-acetyltransferase
MTIEAGPDELYTTRARAADVPALVQLVNGAYRGGSSPRGWTAETGLIGGPRIDAAALEEILGAPDHALLVLRAQSGLFACSQVSKLAADVACLALLAVRPALQGNGIGRQMLAAAERYAREHFAARFMELTVIADREELIAWYERRGYQVTGETRPFPDADARLGLPEHGNLAPRVLRRRIAP